MPKSPRSAAALLCSGLVAFCAPVSAQVQLGMDELKALVTDNTVDVRNLSGGQDFRVHYAASGQMIVQRSDAVEIHGRWDVRVDGSHCVSVDREVCAKVVKNADGTYMRIVDGVPSFKWMRITRGKDL